MSVKEKILSLIPKTQELQEIKVPDLKQYLVNGYNEIRQVKKEKLELETQLEKEKKNKQLYEGALVTLNEFRQRDEDNNEEIQRLKEKIKDKQNEIDALNSQLNTYKIKQYKLEKDREDLEDRIKEKVREAEKKLKTLLCDKIRKTKGNLSKDKVIEIIKNQSNT